MLLTAEENHLLQLDNILLHEVADQVMLIARFGLLVQVLLLAVENHLSVVA